MFRIISSSLGKLQCAFDEPNLESVCVQAFVRGIPVSKPHNIKSRKDLKFNVSIDRFPLVDLPTTIDVLIIGSINSPVAQLSISTFDEVNSIVGVGQFIVSSTEFYHGAIRGRIVNAVNGLSKPILHAIINSTTYRQINVSEGQLLDTGGCYYHFELPLAPSDITSSGFSLVILEPRSELPIYTYTQAPIAAHDFKFHVAQMNQDISRLADDLTKKIIRNEEQFKNALIMQDERITVILEYLSALVFDHPIKQIDSANPADKKQNFLREIENVIHSRHLTPTFKATSGPKTKNLDLQSPALFSGWHSLERDDLGPFRWMAGEAIIAIDDQDIHPTKLEIEASRLFIGDAPIVDASVNGAPCEVDYTASKKAGAFSISLSWPAPAEPSEFIRISLRSRNAGIPQQVSDSKDGRTLSLCVRRLTLSAS